MRTAVLTTIHEGESTSRILDEKEIALYESIQSLKEAPREEALREVGNIIVSALGIVERELTPFGVAVRVATGKVTTGTQPSCEGAILKVFHAKSEGTILHRKKIMSTMRYQGATTTAAPALSSLVKQGLLERTSWGHYRLAG